VTESTSDPPSVRGKSPNLPPPPDDDPASVAVPKLEPPPSSLGAMVQGRAAARPVPDGRETSPWLILALMLVAGLAATVYLYR
jgi:hypothetical protein